MLNSHIKNNIYIITSFLVIMIIAISFIMTIDFFVKINDLVFSVDEKTIGEKTIRLDIDTYNKIKDRLEVKI